jgi:ribosomal protein S20
LAEAIATGDKDSATVGNSAKSPPRKRASEGVMHKNIANHYKARPLEE